ncbi:2-oxoacid:ferredoxin oxidoreductase subunit beta [Candidatus Bathyarchaeota archaeon]|nr:MAG: 2-oxoacid:ferredoxin oxidoreductase subunit beta [Candidatus Bathyarchaeota archaeon]
MAEAKMELAHPLDKYTRRGTIPHIWCPGCGNGIILNAFLKALDELHFDMDRLAVISGIGCIGRIAGYINADAFHTTHGRALPLALGVKVMRPELKVVVISGDGDLFAIGGNHFIHAARRNIDMLVICSNNFNYGMTGGQFGPTTPPEAITSTTPYKNIEHPFNLVQLAAAAGAIYVARWTAVHPRRLKESIKKALLKHGFCFIEVISPCPEEFGRRNRMGTAVDYMRWLREVSVLARRADPSEARIGPDEIVVGEFVDVEGKEEFTDLLWAQVEEARARAERGELRLAL